MTIAAGQDREEQTAAGPGGNTLRFLLAHGMAAAAIKGAALLLSYSFLILFARNVSEAEYGRYAFAVSLCVLLSIVATLGQSTAILRFWSQFLSQNDPSRAKGVLWLGYRTVLIGTAAVIATGGLVVATLDFFYPELPTGYLYAGLFLIFPSAIAGYQASTMRALGYVTRALVPTEILHRGSLPLVVIAVLFSGAAPSAVAVLWASGLLWILFLVPQGLRVLRHVEQQLPNVKARFDLPGWRGASLGLWALAVLGVMSQSSDIIVLGLLLTPEATAGYFVALKLALLFFVLSATVNILTGPMISRAYHGGNLRELQNICHAVCSLLLLPCVTAFLVFLFAGDLVLGLFGANYAKAELLVVVLSFGAMIHVLTGPSYSLLVMTGSERTFLQILAVTRVAMVVLQFALIPLLGPLGAALGNAIGQIALALWARRATLRAIGVEPSVLCLLPARAKVRSSGSLGSQES